MEKYRVDVLATGERNWASNALRFDTPEEAAEWGRGLYGRWTLADKVSVVPDSTPDRAPYVEGKRELVAG